LTASRHHPKCETSKTDYIDDEYPGRKQPSLGESPDGLRPGDAVHYWRRAIDEDFKVEIVIPGSISWRGT
jgi:hypothetical protein